MLCMDSSFSEYIHNLLMNFNFNPDKWQHNRRVEHEFHSRNKKKPRKIWQKIKQKVKDKIENTKKFNKKQEVDDEEMPWKIRRKLLIKKTIDN